MHLYFKFLRPEFPDHFCVSVFLPGIPSVRRAPFRPEVPNAAKRRRPQGAQVPCGEARAAASRDGAEGRRVAAGLPGPGGVWEARLRPRVSAPALRSPTRCGGAAHGAPGGAHAGGWPARGAGES